MPPVWVPASAARAIHAELIREFGGLPGPPREAAFASTLMRPQHLLAHEDLQPPIWRLAAAHGYGFAKNHCFPDGNKRVALAIIDVFLQLNGYELIASEEDAALTILSLAAGQITELDLADWIEKSCKSAKLA